METESLCKALQRGSIPLLSTFMVPYPNAEGISLDLIIVRVRVSQGLPFMRTCTRCNTTLPESRFYKKKRTKDGLTRECDTCLIAASRKGRQERRDRVGEAEWKRIKKQHCLKANYGISLETYEALAEEQYYCCAICQKKTDNLCVDHCHETGRVRGLLCHKCNVGLGHFSDDPLVIERALKYLAL